MKPEELDRNPRKRHRTALQTASCEVPGPRDALPDDPGLTALRARGGGEAGPAALREERARSDARGPWRAAEAGETICLCLFKGLGYCL